MREIYKMSGHCAAHAMWSVSDGETLIPILGFIDKNNKISMQRIAFESSEDAMQHGDNALEKNEQNSKGIVFISDGYITLDEGKTDALIVKIKGYGEFDTKCTLALPYRHSSNEKGFAIHRPKLLEYPEEDAANQGVNMDSFFDGIESHEEAYKIWREKYIDAISPGETSSNSEADFTPAEWELLLQSPYLVFLTVAAADGEIDKKEIKELAKILMEAKEQPSPLLQKILHESAVDVRTIINAIIEKRVNTIDALQSIQQIVDTKLPGEDSIVFKVSLLFIAKQVAEASGGGFLGFGKKISDEEKGAIAAILHTLKIEQKIKKCSAS